MFSWDLSNRTLAPKSDQDEQHKLQTSEWYRRLVDGLQTAVILALFKVKTKNIELGFQIRDQWSRF